MAPVAFVKVVFPKTVAASLFPSAEDATTDQLVLNVMDCDHDAPKSVEIKIAPDVGAINLDPLEEMAIQPDA